MNRLVWSVMKIVHSAASFSSLSPSANEVHQSLTSKFISEAVTMSSVSVTRKRRRINYLPTTRYRTTDFLIFDGASGGRLRRFVQRTTPTISSFYLLSLSRGRRPPHHSEEPESRMSVRQEAFVAHKMNCPFLREKNRT